METAAKLLLLFLVLIIIGTGVGLALYFLVFKKCKKDTDCKTTGQSCNPNGKCVAPDGSCKGDNDCGGSQTCSKDGKCTDPSSPTKKDPSSPTKKDPPSPTKKDPPVPAVVSSCPGSSCKHPGQMCITDKGQWLCSPGLYSDNAVDRSDSIYSWVGYMSNNAKQYNLKTCTPGPDPMSGIQYCPKKCQKDQDGTGDYTCENKSYKYNIDNKIQYCIPDAANNLYCWVDETYPKQIGGKPKNWTAPIDTSPPN